MSQPWNYQNLNYWLFVTDTKEQIDFTLGWKEITWSRYPFDDEKSETSPAKLKHLHLKKALNSARENEDKRTVCLKK